jgi:hypothetical protein
MSLATRRKVALRRHLVNRTAEYRKEWETRNNLTAKTDSSASFNVIVSKANAVVLDEPKTEKEVAGLCPYCKEKSVADYPKSKRPEFSLSRHMYHCKKKQVKNGIQ